MDLFSIRFINADIGYVVGNGIIMKTTNGGTTWVEQNPPINDLFVSQFFFDADTGYVLDYYGYLLKTTNGGNTWMIHSIFPSGSDYISIFFTDHNTGYIAGGLDKILKTTDGGVTWMNQNSGTTNNSLYSVHFTNHEVGYIAGGQFANSGVILKTINGGANWFSATSVPSNCLFSVCFPDEMTGYAVGDYGTILKTTDGGTNWTSQVSGTWNLLFSACFLNADVGFTAGDFGTILKTTDGGGFPVGVNEINLPSEKLKIYPNPSSDQITIKTSGLVNNGYLAIIDLNGKEVLKQTIFNPSTCFDISTLPCGVYFIKAIGEKSVQVGKFIKK
jgi:photosystem II stability/assembly factor-like uncharacterized protein